MSSISKDRREERLRASYAKANILSDRAYNIALGGIVFYGVFLNYLMCLIFGDMLEGINLIVFLIGYFVSCIAGIMMSSKSNNPAISFLGYNLVVIPIGMVLSSVVTSYGLDSALVRDAFLYTLLITGCMIALSVVQPQLFASLGKVLFASLIGLLIAELIVLLLGVDQVITSWIGAGLFSVYIGYDFYRSQQFAKTLDNAVDCALDIYLDIINLFLDILRILSKKK